MLKSLMSRYLFTVLIFFSAFGIVRADLVIRYNFQTGHATAIRNGKPLGIVGTGQVISIDSAGSPLTVIVEGFNKNVYTSSVSFTPIAPPAGSTLSAGFLTTLEGPSASTSATATGPTPGTNIAPPNPPTREPFREGSQSHPDDNLISKIQNEILNESKIINIISQQLAKTDDDKGREYVSHVWQSVISSLKTNSITFLNANLSTLDLKNISLAEFISDRETTFKEWGNSLGASSYLSDMDKILKALKSLATGAQDTYYYGALGSQDVTFTVMVSPKSGSDTTAITDKLTFTVTAQHIPELFSSTGLYFDDLSDGKYALLEGSPSLGNIIVNASNNKDTVGIAQLYHARILPLGKDLMLAASIGAGLKSDSTFRLLAGLSFFGGSGYHFGMTVGLSYGSVTRLDGGYKVNDTFEGTTIPTTNVERAVLFLMVSFR